MAVTQVNLSDQMAVFVQKTNIISGDLGDVGALTTSADSNAVVAINEIESNHNSLASTVSTIQTNLNNLDSDVGTRTSLVTNDRTDLVTAINEVKADANGISSGLGSYLRSDEADTKTVGDLNFVDNVKATFGTDSDMSVFHDGSDGFIRSDVLNIQNAAGSTDYVHIDNSGNVGIGRTPTAYGSFQVLDVAGASGAIQKIIHTGSSVELQAYASSSLTAIGSATNHPLTFTTNDTERMRIDNSGNVGIGTSSPVSQMTLAKTSDLVFTQNGYGIAWGGDNGSPRIYGTSGGSLTFKHGAGSTAMTLTSAGDLRIGQSSLSTPGQGNTTEGLALTGSGRVFISSNSSNYGLGLNRNGDGELTNFSRQGVFKGSINVTTAGVTYNTSSDERLKENIETLQNGTELLKAMRAVTYDWKADGNSDTGFIAQEMNEVMPQAVSEGDDGMLSMDYGRVTPIIVAALQDALKRIDELEAKQCNCGGCS